MVSNDKERDEVWVECLELYVPEVKEVYLQEDSTLEKIIGFFVSSIVERERKANKSQVPYGKININLP